MMDRPPSYPAIAQNERGCRCRLLGCFVLAAALMVPTVVQGQNRTRNRPDAFLEGMVRSLIESEQSGGPRERSNASSSNPHPRLRDVRANLSGFAQEVSHLIAQLYQDVNRTSGLRNLMGQALQVNAKATLLARQSANYSDAAWLANEFHELDQSWRLVEFRLRQLRDLSPQARRYVDRANQYHARLAELLNVSPQHDKSAIVRQAAALANDLLRLLEEIDFDVADPTLRSSLLVEGRRVYQQSRRVASRSNSSSGLDQVQTEYRRFRQLWGTYVAKLRPLNLPYVDRQLKRVHAADRALQELLLLPSEVDRDELTYLTQLLQRDLDQLMDGVTLRNLTTLSNGRDQIVESSSDFYSACGDFAECVQNGESPETMAELYHYLDNSWQRVADIVKDAEPVEARQIYRQLDRSVREIREILAVHPPVDHEQAIQVAASLENLAHHMEHDIRSALSARPGDFSSSFRTQSMRAAQQFRVSVSSLHSELVGGSRPDRLAGLSEQMTSQWNSLLRYVERFPISERTHLNQLRRQMAPSLVELQAMLSI